MIVIAMIFVMVFLILGAALYWLVISQQRSTELERTDVKSFNVSEAGIDAGMLTLKQAWPDQSNDVATVDNAALKTAIVQGTHGLWDPKRADPTQFIKVSLYDNVDAGGQTTTIAYPAAPKWDSNADGRMFVDSTSDVGDDRHRILILAERQSWQLTFPTQLALFANVVDSNGQGLGVTVEDPNPAPTDPYAYYDVHDAQHKGIEPGYAVATTASPTTFDSLINEALQKSLRNIAQTQGTYFSSDTAAAAFLTSGQAGGKVVYIESDTPVTIESSVQIGSVEAPVVVVIDTPDGSVNGWDMRGGAEFYGILVVVGDGELRGTCSTHGAMYVKGTLCNKGNGTDEEINYNQSVIDNINGQYVISVNIVPNTWEEFAPASTTGS
ncbi:MAG: hypothetical protein M1274_00415 [Actinobacteria bacterium]|nr:hypothetical protein [Actinomycetota bacterium]